MTTSIWKKVRDDKDSIVWTNKLSYDTEIRAVRRSPSPRSKNQFWIVTGMSDHGIYFREDYGLNFKKDAEKSIIEAKFKWEAKNVDRYRLA